VSGLVGRTPHRFRRTWPVALLSALLPLLLTGCGAGKHGDADELRDVLRRTASQARQFTYTDSSREAGRAVSVSVTGVVEDDFRYAATLAVDGTVVYEERVRDDAITARIGDDRGFTLMARGSGTDQASGATHIDGQATPSPVKTTGTALARTSHAADAAGRQSLLQHRWTLDPLGAPSLLAGRGSTTAGGDPILEALSLFRYVSQAAETALVVQKFSPDRLTYRANRDPFPRPDGDAGEVRFDLERPPLPRVKQAGPGGVNTLPSIANFRKMSVYVRNGVVVRVLEVIEVATLIDDLVDIYGLVAEGAGDRGIRLPEGITTEQRVDLIMGVLNELRQAKGEEPIRVRSMVCEFEDVGVERPVVLPTDAVVGSLVALRNRGSATAGLPTARPSALPAVARGR
jgi:hypothetical protein